MPLNPTHDPVRRSWLEDANTDATDFPLQNLPYGVFRTAGGSTPRIGVAIGTHILDLVAATQAGLLPVVTAAACRQSTLNALMALGSPAWSALRARLSELLGADSCPAGAIRSKVESCLVPMKDAEMLLPAAIGDYTDFYASIFHATNVGSMLRPDQPLLPNYKWVPIGYHGRGSSLVVSGTSVRRPHGQLKLADAPAPVFGPCRNLDYELELGVFVGPGNAPGARIPIAEAAAQLFGVVLLNDWSARDIQTWEYQPLGPFLAKNFATSISPWVVTMEALAPFRAPAFASARRRSRAPALPRESWRRRARRPRYYHGSLAAHAANACRRPVAAPLFLPEISSKYIESPVQLLTHHASNGCNLLPGDLLGSGTVSGATKGRPWLPARADLARHGVAQSCLTARSANFLQDGDEVILRGYAERAGARRIGLGECRGVVLPAVPEHGPATPPGISSQSVLASGTSLPTLPCFPS